MQKAGDSTQESAFRATNSGIARWFPDGFHTEGVDWSALEEHLSTVPDLAFETTTASNSNLLRGGKTMPKGVSALHLTVSCNPMAPLSLIQRLIEVNPDALHQTEDQHGWNVLICALKFNTSLRVAEDGNNSLVEALLEARPDLVYDGATSIDDYGLPPLAYVKCPGLVPKLVKRMPPKLVASLLKKVFMRRKLLGGSVEAMVQIITELSRFELQENRTILSAAIVPEKLARKQSLIKYVLIQTSKCGRQSSERSDLTRLIDPIIQAFYRVNFQTEFGFEKKAPPTSECLKALIQERKLEPKVLELYSSVMSGNAEYAENMEFMEPEMGGTIEYPGPNFPAQNENTDDNPRAQKLLKQKEALDLKVEQSFEALRQAAASLENYKAMYSSTVGRLINEAQDEPSNASVIPATTNSHPLLKPDAESSMAAIALSSLPPTPPRRQKSAVESGDPKMAATIQDAIENMQAASGALDRYNHKLSTDSGNLLRQQEDLATVDLGYFRNAFHDQAVRAMESIAELQIEKVGLQKCIDEIKGQLKDTDSLSDRKVQTLRRNELNLKWATLNGELREVSRKVENSRELVSNRRQDLGGYMIKARRLSKYGVGPANKVVRSRAARFLREAKKEMRELMATLVATAPNYKPVRSKHRRRTRKQHQLVQLVQQQQREQKEADEELSRMTKRMKL